MARKARDVLGNRKDILRRSKTEIAGDVVEKLVDPEGARNQTLLDRVLNRELQTFAIRF